MSLSDLVTPVGTRIYHTLTGDMDEDRFLRESDMSKSHWDLLMGCHHQGSCDEDCEEASKYFEIKYYGIAKRLLIEAGIERETLKDDNTVLKYYLWMIAGDIQDEMKSAV